MSIFRGSRYQSLAEENQIIAFSHQRLGLRGETVLSEDLANGDSEVHLDELFGCVPRDFVYVSDGFVSSKAEIRRVDSDKVIVRPFILPRTLPAGSKALILKKTQKEIRPYVRNIRQRIALADIGTDFTVHKVQYGERLDLIAWSYWKSPDKWWIIADVNNLLDPLGITVGQELVVPSNRFVRTL